MTLLETLQNVNKSKDNTKSNVSEFIKEMLRHFRFYDYNNYELESFILKGYSNDVKLYFLSRLPDEDYLNDDYLTKEEKNNYIPTYDLEYGKFAIYLKGVLIGQYYKDECGWYYGFVSTKSRDMLYRYLMDIKITLKFEKYDDIISKEELESEV